MQNNAGAIYDALLFCDVLDNKHLILLYSIAEYNTSSKCHMKTNVILQKCYSYHIHITQISSCIKKSHSYFMTKNVIYHMYCPLLLPCMVYDSVSQTLYGYQTSPACKLVVPTLQELAVIKIKYKVVVLQCS